VTMRRRPAVAVVATLDTKAEEAEFIAARIRAAGLSALLVDISLRDGNSDAAITRRDIARAAGQPEALALDLPKTEVMDLVARGTAALLGSRVAAGELAALIGLGGGSGTWLVARAAGGLPLGFPKMLVTTVAGHVSADVLAGSDVVVVPSITDIAGLNPILRRVLTHAASAICAMAMADTDPMSPAAAGGLVGMSMFGVTTEGGTVARRRLEQAGYDVAVFHANGQGGRTLERLAQQGGFIGVLDWTTTELVDELAGGRCSAGPSRLDAAVAAGLPQVVVPGAMDVINAGDPDQLAPRFQDRLRHLHRADSVLIRSSSAENHAVGRIIGRKLSSARSPVRVIVPLGGFSSLDATGGPFRDRRADESFLAGLAETAGPGVLIETSDANINDAPFATLCAERLITAIAAAEPERGDVRAAGRKASSPGSTQESR
jgi:uncharacterized protein (UPF0261 family)